MVREVLTICVGQCGIQMGQAIWEQYCAEHGVNKKGKISERSDNDSAQCFFEETRRGRFVPRNVMVDLEPNVIDDIKTSKYSAIFDPYFLLAGKEDAANNFMRGHYTVGKEMIDTVNDRLRKLVDNCDNVQGFIINNATAGGTGSGLGALILERVAVDYRKKSKIGFHVFPSPNYSTTTVAPYNTMECMHWYLDHTEVSICLDNEAMYELCQRYLDIKRPSYDNLNRLIAKVVSSMTASLRFESSLNANLQDFQTNLVPFPRLHFMIPSMAPLASKEKKETTNRDVPLMTEQCFDPQSFFVKIPDFDPEDDKYMAASLQYRGNVEAKEASDAVKRVKESKKATFVDWMPTGFKVGLNATPAAEVEDDDLANFDENVTVIGNNTAWSRLLSERIAKKFDLLYSQHAFLFWFVGEGGGSGEWPEAREDLGFLQKDYMDLLTKSYSTEEEDDDEEW